MLLALAYLFFCGSLLGWVIELFFRRFFSKANPERKWINPGFCVGPYIPLYGFGLGILYLLSVCEPNLGIENPVLSKIVLMLLIMFSLTAIEYLAGWICLKAFHIRLWDYSNQKWNVQGLICPKFTLAWGCMGAAYLFFVHAHILSSLAWLSENLAFTFVIGFFYGVFLVDVVYSTHLVSKIKAYAKENDIIVKWEKLKSDILVKAEKLGEKTQFLFPMRFHRLITEAREKVRDRRENRTDEQKGA